MRTSRLRRLERLTVQHPLFFVTFCTHDRAPLLATTGLHAALTALIEFCERAANRGVYIGHYVVMPDHLHLFVAIADGATTLSLWIKSLKNSLSKHLRKQGVRAPHWQKSFFDHVMRSADSYSEKWDYVRANPVRASLVANAEAWPYQGKIHDLAF